MLNQEDRALADLLEPMINESRLDLLREVIGKRTRYLTVVVEDVYQPQNASAVLRTCDCFGIQDVHIIENRNTYELNPDVELGAAQWLSLHKYNENKNNTVDAINTLKAEGYRIVATSPHKDDVDLEDFDLHKGKTAFLFGTERCGLSNEALEHADEFLKIPMIGFTESYNISVSAAIILYHLRSKLDASDIEWGIGEEEYEKIWFQWVKNSVNNSSIIESAFKRNYGL